MSDRRNQAPRRVDQAEPGLFRIRLVKGGPWVAAAIECDALGVWSAVIDGERQDPAHPDWTLAESVARIWHYGDRISDSDYEFLIERARWCRANAPESPEANPKRPVNIGREPPPF